MWKVLQRNWVFFVWNLTYSSVSKVVINQAHNFKDASPLCLTSMRPWSAKGTQTDSGTTPNCCFVRSISASAILVGTMGNHNFPIMFYPCQLQRAFHEEVGQCHFSINFRLQKCWISLIRRDGRDSLVSLPIESSTETGREDPLDDCNPSFTAESARNLVKPNAFDSMTLYCYSSVKWNMFYRLGMQYSVGRALDAKRRKTLPIQQIARIGELPAWLAAGRKYSSFDSHEDWWEYINKCQRLSEFMSSPVCTPHYPHYIPNRHQ